MSIPTPTYYWRANEGTGTTAASSATANDLTLNNGATWATGVLGGVTYAIQFDGINDNASMATDADFDDGDTIAFWINFNNVNVIPVSDTSSNNDYVYFNTVINVALRATAAAVNFAVPTIIPGNWYHFAATRNGTNASVWWNGTASSSNPQAIGASAMLVNKFGSQGAGGTFPFSGEMDELAIWKGTELGDSQIKELYNGGVPKNLAYTPNNRERTWDWR